MSMPNTARFAEVAEYVSAVDYRRMFRQYAYQIAYEDGRLIRLVPWGGYNIVCPILPTMAMALAYIARFRGNCDAYVRWDKLRIVETSAVQAQSRLNQFVNIRTS